jgi:hypothetical protein
MGPGVLPPGVVDSTVVLIDTINQTSSFFVGALAGIAFVLAASYRW